MVAFTILEGPTPIERSELVQHWIKVAYELLQCRNIQSCKAVVSALSTTPIMRLKKTWPLVSKKLSASLETMKNLLSEQENFNSYRLWQKSNMDLPGIPFIGIFLHDLAYIRCLKDSDPNKVKRMYEIFKVLDYYRFGEPYQYEKYLASRKIKASEKAFSYSNKNGLIPYNLHGYMAQIKSLDKDSVGLMCHHWIFTRKRYEEGEIDQLSNEREPKSKSLQRDDFFVLNFTQTDGEIGKLEIDISETFAYLKINGLDAPPVELLYTDASAFTASKKTKKGVSNAISNVQSKVLSSVEEVHLSSTFKRSKSSTNVSGIEDFSVEKIEAIPAAQVSAFSKLRNTFLRPNSIVADIDGFPNSPISAPLSTFTSLSDKNLSLMGNFRRHSTDELGSAATPTPSEVLSEASTSMSDKKNDKSRFFRFW